MKDLEPGARGKAMFAGLCGVCCGVPMLVIFGVLSFGAVVVSGASVVSAIAAGVALYLLVRRRSHRSEHHIPVEL